MDPSMCKKHEYFDNVIARCSHCDDICVPLRGTERQCMEFCQDDYLNYFPRSTTIKYTVQAPDGVDHRTTIYLMAALIVLSIILVTIIVCIVISKKPNAMCKTPNISLTFLRKLKRPKRMKATMESAVVKEFNEQHILVPNPQPLFYMPNQSMVPSSENTISARYHVSVEDNSQTPLLASVSDRPTTSVQMESQPPNPDEIITTQNTNTVRNGTSPDSAEQTREETRVVDPVPPQAEHLSHDGAHLSSLHLDSSQSFNPQERSHNGQNSYIAQPSDAGLYNSPSNDRIAEQANPHQDDSRSEISYQEIDSDLIGVGDEQEDLYSSHDEDADSALASSFFNSTGSARSFNNLSLPPAAPSYQASQPSVDHPHGAAFSYRENAGEENRLESVEVNERQTGHRRNSDTGIESNSSENPHLPSRVSNSRQSAIEECDMDGAIDDNSCANEVQNMYEIPNESSLTHTQPQTCNIQDENCDIYPRVHGNGPQSGPAHLGPSPQRSPSAQFHWASMPPRSGQSQRGFTRDQLRSRLGDIDKMDDIELGLNMNTLHDN